MRFPSASSSRAYRAGSLVIAFVSMDSEREIDAVDDENRESVGTVLGADMLEDDDSLYLSLLFSTIKELR